MNYFRKHPVLKKIASVFLYALYVFSIVVIVDYFFYCAYVSRMYGIAVSQNPQRGVLPAVRNVNASTMLKLGQVMTGKASSFVNFDTQKRPGTIRIGCFGDSYTYGDEVGGSFDYPGLLQTIFRREGYDDVEVINFGSSWYGFSQAFIMWQYVGRNYDLDYVLLGPAAFEFLERETTFNHTVTTSGESPDFMHARFIVKDKQLKMLKVYGDTYESRFRNYFRFIPFKRYLFYDTNTPPFLACLLPRGKELKRNPFYYYKGTTRQEARAIHALQLLAMAAHGKAIVMGDYHKNAVALAKLIHKENITADQLHRPTHFPYQMQKFHNSPLGNYFLAKQMFRLITGKNSPLDIIITADIDKKITQDAGAVRQPLYEYSAMQLEIEGIKIGDFKNTFEQYHVRMPRFDISQTNIVSLLAFRPQAGSIADAVFLPLDFSVPQGAPVKMRISSNGWRQEYHLGDVFFLNQDVGIGVVEAEGFLVNEHKNIIKYKASSPVQCGDKNAEIEIIVNNRVILRASTIDIKNRLLYFQSVKFNPLMIFPGADYFIDCDRLGKKGIIDLVLISPDGSRTKVAFARWEKKAL